MYGYHYFKITKEGTEITGLLSIQGPVAEIAETITAISKKSGVECVEITRDEAAKIQTIEVM